MRKKDRLIKEAFEVYQSANQKDDTEGQKKEMEIEYTEGFEDKIYRCIEKLNIVNPRQKARKIWLGILLILLIGISGGFLLCYHSHKPVNATKEIDALYKEARERLEKQGCAPTGSVSAKGSNINYSVIRLDKELTNRLKASDIKYQKVKEKSLKEMTQSWGGCCMGYDLTVWNAYELSDRDSHYYYILKDDSGQLAIARYAGAEIGNEKKDRADTEEVCKKIFGIESAKDIRSITLERYQAKSKEEPEKLVAMYVGEQEKSYILSFFRQDNLIYNVREKGEQGDEGYADVRWQPIEKLRSKKWEDAVKLMPQNCYLLALENKYHENFLVGVVKDGDRVQIFTDMMHGQEQCMQLSSEEQEEIAQWIDKAEEK